MTWLAIHLEHGPQCKINAEETSSQRLNLWKVFSDLFLKFLEACAFIRRATMAPECLCSDLSEFKSS